MEKYLILKAQTALCGLIKNKMKNILITGGAGFLGTHLTETLLKNKGVNVIAIDNFITSSYYNIEEFIRQPNYEFLKLDITQEFALEKFPELNKFLVKVYGVEEIYHLACPTSPKDYDRLPLQTCLANSHATKNSLDIARRYKSSFLFASAGAVYGAVAPQNQPVKETSVGILETLGPRSCYSDGKRFAENLVVYYGSEYNFPRKIARIFSTYGPKMRLDDGRIIPDIIMQALKGEPVIIYGGQNTTSTFCYVDDIVDGLIKLMASGESGPINLGSQDVYILEDVAKAIIGITESKSKIIYKESFPYHEKEPIPNIALAKEKLEWLAITGIEEGLLKTVQDMQASDIISFKNHASDLK